MEQNDKLTKTQSLQQDNTTKETDNNMKFRHIN